MLQNLMDNFTSKLVIYHVCVLTSNPIRLHGELWNYTAPHRDYLVTVCVVSKKMYKNKFRSRVRVVLVYCALAILRLIKLLHFIFYHNIITGVYNYYNTVLVNISPATGTETYLPTTVIYRCRRVVQRSSSVWFWLIVDADCALG